MKELPERLFLYLEESSIIVAPPEDLEHALVIDRVTFKLEIQDVTHTIFESSAKPIEIFGCLGLINLLSGPFLIVISQREEVAKIVGCPIYEVTKSSIIQIAKNAQTLSEDDRKEEREYLSLLDEFLEACRFYYSTKYDITHTAQRISQMSAETKAKSLWERVDERFFWNKGLQSTLIANKMDAFILPVVDGFIKMVAQTTHESEWAYVFISRRGCLRTGARYHTRGADPMGNVANFVETEQIVEYANILSSFVQVRGSIPFFWQQKGKGLKPRPVVDNSASAELAFQRHMEGLIKEYGPVVVISLIDQRGVEVPVGESFETHIHILNNPNLKYITFDFHEKCKNNKYENLSQLLDQVTPDVTKYSYFLRDAQGRPILNQTGICRTNCIDCLDRTNVVQSVIARFTLQIQMNHLGILSSHEKLEMHPAVESMFKHVWADNADIMSEQYTGTVALKTDFTRTGKRSVKGSVMDGVNSAKRYINKSFRDDERQEAIDLFLGRFVVEKWNLSDPIEEGGYRFLRVSVVNQWTSKGMEAVVQVNVITRVITWYLVELAQRTDVHFDTLLQIEKSSKDYRLLRLHHIQSPHPVCFLFPSSSIREQFVQLVYFTRPSLNPTSGFQRNPENPNLNLKIFIGTWNVVSSDPSVDDMPKWIPKGRDIYAIGTQNNEHKVPSPLTMPSREYWHLMIRQYLGPEYVTLTTIATELTGLIVLVRQTMSAMVNNLEISPVRLRQKNPPQEEKKGGFAKFKEAREKLKDQIKTKNNGPLVGGAIMFRFIDTAFCLINYCHDSVTNGEFLNNDEMVMQLKGNNDLHNDFHHVFWFGTLGKNDYARTQKQWVVLYSSDQIGGSSVLWRALYDAPMLSEIEVGATPLDSSPHPPVFTLAAVGVFLPPPVTQPLLPKRHFCTIALTHLVCSLVKPDSYLLCHAPFLIFSGKTGYLKKGEDCWSEDIAVRCFVVDKDYLDMLHLHIELWERVLIGDEVRLGAGVVSMKSSSDAQPLAFVSSLWRDSEFIGEVSGEISLRFHKDEQFNTPDPSPASTPRGIISSSSRSASPDPSLQPPDSSAPSSALSSVSASAPSSVTSSPTLPAHSSPNPTPTPAAAAAVITAPSTSAPAASTTTTTTSTTTFGGGFFGKLPSASRAFFGKPLPSAVPKEQELKDPTASTIASTTAADANADAPNSPTMSQPLTSPRNSNRSSRSPTPTPTLLSPSPSTTTSSAPAASIAAASTLATPAVVQNLMPENPTELPPKLPPKNRRTVQQPPQDTSAFAPIPFPAAVAGDGAQTDITSPQLGGSGGGGLDPTPSLLPSPGAATSADPTAAASIVPAAKQLPLVSPRENNGSGSTALLGEDGEVSKGLLDRITRIGMSMVRNSLHSNVPQSQSQSPSPQQQQQQQHPNQLSRQSSQGIPPQLPPQPYVDHPLESSSDEVFFTSPQSPTSNSGSSSSSASANSNGADVG